MEEYKKNEEMTKQMEEVWREHHNPELQAKKKAKHKREEDLKNC
jgi:hypothetical protein